MAQPINHPDAFKCARGDAGALVWIGKRGWCIMPSGGSCALPCGRATAQLAIRTHGMTETRFPDGILYSAA